MPTLVFVDEATSPEAGRRATGADDTVVVRALERERHLRLFSQFAVSEEALDRVGEDSERVTRELGEALPRSLRTAGPEGLPAVWECYEEYFRSWAAGPVLANAAIVRCAAEQSGASRVAVVENARRPGWWSYRQQVYEAALAGLAGTGATLEGHPRGWVRSLRLAVAALGGGVATGLGQGLAGRQFARRRKWLASLPVPGPCDVLFLPVGDSAGPIVRRIAATLESEHGLSSAAVMLDPLDAAMARGGGDVPFHYLDQFQRPGPWGTVGLWAAAVTGLGWPWWFLHAALHAPRGKWGALWPALRNRLVITLARDLQQTLADRVATRSLLDTCRPKVVVAFHPHWWRLAPIILTAQAQGVRAVYAQHGVYFGESDCVRPLAYDEHFVFGEDAAENLGRRATGGAVTIAGHCLYDDLVLSPPTPGEVARALRGDAGRVVLVATQNDELLVYDPRDPQWWLRGVVEACRELGARCLVKLHPSDIEVWMYEELEREMPETVRLVRHGEAPLHELLALSDVLVTRDSTVVFEAALLGVPAMTVNLTGMKDRVAFAAEGGSAGVYAHEGLAPTLRRLLDGDAGDLVAERQRFISRHLGPQDGRATERIAGAIARHARGE